MCKPENSMEMSPCSLTTFPLSQVGLVSLLHPTGPRVCYHTTVNHWLWASLGPVYSRCLVKFAEERKGGRRGREFYIFHIIHTERPPPASPPPSLLPVLFFCVVLFCYLKLYYAFICKFIVTSPPPKTVKSHGDRHLIWWFTIVSPVLKIESC